MPTFSFGTSARAWLDGKQAACSMNTINMEAELDEVETTTLCSTIKDYIPGLAEVTIEMEGFFDTNTASPATTLEALLEARFGQVFPVTFAPEGGGQVGDAQYMLNGFLQDYKLENTVDEAASLELTFRCTSAMARGRVLHTDAAAVTATGNDAGSVNNGAATTNGGVAVLQVSAVSGTSPTLVVTIQHSVNGTVWTDLASFPSQNAVNGEYLVIPAGTTVNQYLRTRWVVGGTTPSFNFNVGFKRN